jgi:hypothetical protein
MNQDVRENDSSDTEEGQDISALPKPAVMRVTMPDGRVRLLGVSAAARWLGVTDAALSALARGVNGIPITWEARAREEFPGLFGN